MVTGRPFTVRPCRASSSALPNGSTPSTHTTTGAPASVNAADGQSTKRAMLYTKAAFTRYSSAREVPAGASSTVAASPRQVINTRTVLRHADGPGAGAQWAVAATFSS